MGVKSAVAILTILAAAAPPAAQAAHKHRPKPPRPRQVMPINPSGTVGVTTARRLFAATVAPLPGVKPPKRGYPYVRSGSGAVRAVLSTWRQLTPAQQAAVAKALPGIAVPGGAAPRATARSAPRAHAANFTLAAFEHAIDEAVPRLNARFEPDLKVPVQVTTGTVRGAGAVTYLDVDGVCQIKLTPAGQTGALTYMRETALHELTHCYQDQLNPGHAYLPWLDEGSAEWVGAVLGLAWNGATSSTVAQQWKIWFGAFTTPLFQHSYSALPFYAHLAHTRAEAQVFHDLSLAYALPDPKSQAYGVLVDAAADEFRHTTAASGTRLKSLGTSWDAAGPGIPSAANARYNPPSVTIGNGDYTLSAKAYAHAVVGLNPSAQAEVVRLKLSTPASAWGLIHHEGGDDRLQSADDTRYCAGEHCTCPDGTKLQRLGDDAYLALYGYKQQAKVTLKPESLQKACGSGGTDVAVTGGFIHTFTKRGFCVVHEDAVNGPAFTFQEGPHSVHLAIKDFKGPGDYVVDPFVVKGVAYPAKTGGASWNQVNMAKPYRDYPSVLHITSVTHVPGKNAFPNSGGNIWQLTGTVDTWAGEVVPHDEDPRTYVHVRGHWTCDNYLPKPS